MISFYRDSLVPPELCTLLYQTVPEQYHVPVVFTNHREHCEDIYEIDPREKYPLGTCFHSHVAINLNQIWGSAVGIGSSSHGSRATRLWYKLLFVCLHEFGHIATDSQRDHVSGREYEARGRGYEWVEQLADVWASRQIWRLAEHDKRLGQPRQIGGYFGALLAKSNSRIGTEYGVDWRSLRDWRCYKVDAQLSAGDVAMMCNFWIVGEYHGKPDYRFLRKLSDKLGLGIDYVDGAGRKLRFYTWGDLLKLEPYAKSSLWQQRQQLFPDPDPGPEQYEDIEIPF